MAIAYLTDNSKTIAAGAWSDATGFADNATLVVDRGTQYIDTALTAGSGLTTGIDYIHFRKGFSGTVGGGGASLATKFSSYTTLPNVIFSSGTLYLTCTNTCPAMRVFGGIVYIVSGTVTLLEIIGGQVIMAAAAVATTLRISGGSFLDPAEGSATMTTLNQYGGVVQSRRPITTVNLYDAVGGNPGAPSSQLTYSNPTGPTTVNQYSGVLTHLQGTIGTYNGIGGRFDSSRAVRDLTIGSTATNLYPNINFKSKSSGATVTVSNQTDIMGGSVGYDG